MHQVLPIHFKGRGKWKILAEWMSRVGRIVNGMTGYGGIDVEFVGDECRIIYRGTSGGLNLKKFAFAWNAPGPPVSPYKVRIGAGYIEGRYGYANIPEAVVAVGGNAMAKHLIYVAGSGAQGQIMPQTVAENDFTGDTSHTWRRALYRVYVENGRVVLDRVCAGVGGIVL